MSRARGVVSATAALAVVAGALVANSAGAYARPGTTTRVDVGPHGEQATIPALNLSCQPQFCATPTVISGNGRYVAFASNASNLVAHDNDNGPDVFVRDLRTGVTTMASVSSSGGQQLWVNPLTASIAGLAISADGRYVAFGSNATTLVVGDTNLAMDAFVHDMKTGDTTRVDVSSSNGQASQGIVAGLSMSADGRYVAFASASSDLVSGDTNGDADVFVRDQRNGTTVRASVSTAGAQGDGASGSGFSLSPTGRWLVFGSDATNLVSGDVNSQRDVFLRDLTKNTTSLISVRPDGSAVPLLGGNSDVPYGPGSAISADGRYVVFGSNSALLIPNDTNGNNSDWFVRDRATGRTQRVSVASDGADRDIASTASASITPNGRLVVFRTAESLVAEDQGSCPTTPGSSEGDNDIYVHDMRTGAVDLISRSSSGAAAFASAADAPYGCQNSADPSISDDGRIVVFDSNATNLVHGDTNKTYDVFVRYRGADLAVDGWVASAPSSAPPPAPPVCVGAVCLPPTAALTGAQVTVRPAVRDVFVDIATTARAVDGNTLYGLDFAIGRDHYQLRMQRVPGLPGAAQFDVFRLAGARWIDVAGVGGGYGTVGADVVAAIPLAALGIHHGDVALRDVIAFAGVGAVSTGAVRVVSALQLHEVAHV